MADPIDQRSNDLKLKQLRKDISGQESNLNELQSTIEVSSDVLSTVPQEWASLKAATAAMVAAATASN
jgi:hypothetical protein